MANQGDANAQYNLGFNYRKGWGVGRRDYAEAVKWYRKAAGQGYALAQTDLGLMYEDGKGVPRDYGQAVKWYRKAADQDYAIAQIKLGFMYGNGRGGPRDYAVAHMWYSLAAMKRITRAIKSRDIVEKKMTPADISKAHRLAREWWAKHGKK